MSDYTPTTEEVREDWAYEHQEIDYEGSPTITLEEAFARFDRWLADLNRKIAAEVWDEGWDACMEYADGPDWGQAPPNPYRADRTTKETP